MNDFACTTLRTCGSSLLLVNRSHPLPAPVHPQLAAPDPAYPHIDMEHHAALLLSSCINAAGGSGKIVPVSGWRSHEEQQAIWDDTMAKEGSAFTRSYVAYPGCSEHETGLAIDLALAAPEIDFIRPDFPYDGVCGEFRKIAPSYGFVERYKIEKQPITGIAAEPWHFRYVGIPHALLMTQYDVCLEEYIELLGHQSLTCVLKNGRHAMVSRFESYDEAENAADKGELRQILPDNTGGFILTRWEALS